MQQIFCAIPHSSAFDGCFPLLERLQERGRIEPYILLGPCLLKVELRAKNSVLAAGHHIHSRQ
jgi:hypothetical protein